MRYAYLVYADGTKLDALTDIERTRLRRESLTCEDELRRNGHLITVSPLASTATATTLRVREGRQITSDGPAVEAAEQLDAVLVLEARDLNEAIRLAAKLPGARMGSVEIRPIAARAEAVDHQGGEEGASRAASSRRMSPEGYHN